jgi:hypothetical protein
MQAPRDFSEFWPLYLAEHKNPVNRALHYIGTGGAYLLLALFIWHGRFASIPLALVFGYGFAWVGHFFVESNKPASFKYPLWSFIADGKMLLFKLTGQMPGEMIRLFGSTYPPPDVAPRART